MVLLGIANGSFFIMQSAEAADNSSEIGRYWAAAANVTDRTSGTNSGGNGSPSDDPNNSNVGYHLMTEDELMLELTDEGTQLYRKLSPEGKQLVLKVASMRCAGTNLCAGLNACATDKNDCAGKGSCKGKGKCGLSDKNLAVKLVYEKMAKKRADATR
jgi:hypothetical protein